MGRKKKTRIVRATPHFAGFDPAGCPQAEKESIVLRIEEYEALGLCDYEWLTQAEAAERMDVSRPTFTRIYENARRKIAQALVEGRPVRFAGGCFETICWKRCARCSVRFIPADGTTICPLCGIDPATGMRTGSDNRTGKTAVAAESLSPDGPVSPYAGRCRHYLVFDPETGDLVPIDNPYRDAPEGAGENMADRLVREGVRTVVAGRFGAKTFDRLRASGVGLAVPEQARTPRTIIQSIQTMNTFRIAVPTRNGAVDDHFGHCESYSIFTVENGRIAGEPESLPAPQGCGCKSGIASVLQEKGVTVMLAGNMGAGALNVLSRHGIKVFRGCSGEVRPLVEAYLAGGIADSGESCHAHGDSADGHVCGHHHA